MNNSKNVLVAANGTLNFTVFTEPQTPAWFYPSILVIAFGSLGFIFLIIVHCSYRRVLNGSDILLLSLFFSQLAFLDFTHSLWTAENRFYPTTSKIYFKCDSASVVAYMLVYAQNWIGFLLAINRFVATVVPHRYAFWSSRKVVAILLGIAWAGSLIVALLPYHQIHSWYGETKGMSSCNIRFRSKAMAVGMSAFGYYIPLAGLGTIYLAIFISLEISGRFLNRGAQMESPAMMRRIKLSKMLFLSCIWYVICFVPAPVLAMYNYYGSANLIGWLRILFMLGLCGNPVIFFGLNRDYQKTARQLIGRMLGVTAKVGVDQRSQMVSQTVQAI